MNLQSIIQRENERLDDFIERVIREVHEKNIQGTIEFLNGVKLEINNYDFAKDDVTEKILFDHLQQHHNKLQTLIKENASQIPKKSSTSIKENENIQDPIDQQTDEMTRIVQCIDFLEEELQKLQTSNIKMYEEKLEELNNLLEQTTETITKQVEIDDKFNNDKCEYIINTAKEQIDQIDTRIKIAEEKLNEYEVAREANKEKLEQENQLLSQYEQELEQLIKDENFNTTKKYYLEARIDFQKDKKERLEDAISYWDEQICNLEVEIGQYREQKKTIRTESIKECREIQAEHEAKYGKTQKKDGKLYYPEVPEIKKISDKIKQVENIIEKEKQKTVTFDEVRTMVKDGVTPAELVEKLNELTHEFNNPEIEDKIGLNSTKIKDRSEEKEKVKTEILECSKRLESSDNYINKEEQQKDQERIEELKAENLAVTEQIKELKEQLVNVFVIPNLKKQLKTARRNKEKLMHRLELNLDEDVVKESYVRRIERLESKEENLLLQLEQAKSNKKLVIKSRVENKIAELRKLRRNNNDEIETLQRKKTEEYIDEEKIEADKLKLQSLQEELKKLENSEQDLTKVSVEDVKQVIVEEYMKLIDNKKEIILEEPEENYEEIELEEPVESYEDAPKSLIEKIKSNKFIKKAARALASIVAGVIIIAGIKGIPSDKHTSAPDVITESEIEEKEEEEITITDQESGDLTEPTSDIEREEKEDNGKSVIENMQDDALADIISEKGEAIVYEDVFAAAEEANGLRVNENTLSWQDATPGAIYAVNDNESIKINLSDAEEYIEEGYKIVSAYVNDGEIIGFHELQLTSGLESTGKSK